MSERINQVRRRVGTGREVLTTRDDRSMRLLELGIAGVAIAAAILLAVGRP